MKISKIIQTLLLFVVFFSVSCDKIDELVNPDPNPNPNDTVTNPLDKVSDQPDDQGNVLLINYADWDLALYNGDSLWRRIPASVEDFLINVPNPNNNTLDLKLHKIIDGKMEATIFKRWQWPFASDVEPEHRSTWRVSGDNTEMNTGVINFSFFDSENYVEIYLNSRNGSLIKKLKPGDQNVGACGLDYATYTLFMRYLYSDPNTPNGQEELGWIETQIVNGVEEAIWVVFNKDRQSADILISPWNGGGALTQTYGNLRVTNLLSAPVQIWADQQTLIENIIFTDGFITNSSTIPYNGTSEYTVPVGQYTFKASKLPYNNFIAEYTIEITSDTTAIWIVQ